MCQEQRYGSGHNFLIRLASAGLRFVGEFFDLDQRMPPVTRSDGFHKVEESMTEKSGNRNPGRRDLQEHNAVDGGKKRRFIVSCARKNRRGERCQGCQISGQAREGVGMNMSKNFPEQSCNGCCVNQEVAILHLLERTSHFSYWVDQL